MNLVEEKKRVSFKKGSMIWMKKVDNSSKFNSKQKAFKEQQTADKYNIVHGF